MHAYTVLTWAVKKREQLCSCLLLKVLPAQKMAAVVVSPLDHLFNQALFKAIRDDILVIENR